MSKMVSYFKFCDAVLNRAWQIAWAVVIERSIRAIVRDLVILIIAVFSLLEMRGYLERINALPQHDNFLAETLIWAALVASATVAIFAATFVFCAIFIAPFQLYQEQTEKLAALSQAESGRRLPQLHEFYVAVGEIIYRNLPKDMPSAEFDKYLEEAKEWIDTSAQWIKIHLGTTAEARFHDIGGGFILKWDRAINEDHNKIINVLVKYRDNLTKLIETNIFDQKK